MSISLSFLFCIALCCCVGLTLRASSTKQDGVNLHPSWTLPVRVNDGALRRWRTEPVIGKHENFNYINRMKSSRHEVDFSHHICRFTDVKGQTSMTNMDRIDEKKLFKPCKEVRTRGHSKRAQKIQCKSLVRRNTFSQRVVNDWNELPDAVVTIDSIYQFTGRLEMVEE